MCPGLGGESVRTYDLIPNPAPTGGSGEDAYRRINDLVGQIAAITQQRDHIGAQCVAWNAQLAEAFANVRDLQAQANTGPSKVTLRSMLNAANASARLIDNQRAALVQELQGAD